MASSAMFVNQENKEARSKLKQYFETRNGLTKQYEMVNNLSQYTEH